MLMSSGLRLSAILTSEVTDCPPSLIDEAAICECSSMIPAERCLPVASTILADASCSDLPTCAIFPSFTSTSVFSNFPSASLVHTVAFLNKMVSCFGASVQPNAVN